MEFNEKRETITWLSLIILDSLSNPRARWGGRGSRGFWPVELVHPALTAARFVDCVFRSKGNAGTAGAGTSALFGQARVPCRDSAASPLRLPCLPCGALAVRGLSSWLIFETVVNSQNVSPLILITF